VSGESRSPIWLVVNARAGRGRGAQAGASAREALEHRGTKVETFTTTGPGDAAAIARRGRHEGAAVVAAVGGDGTLHEVLNGLAGDLLEGTTNGERRPLLGAIPVGSGNDYAKMLQVSRTDPRVAALALLDGQAQAVDIGVVEGAAPREGEARPELFLNNLGLMFAGAANARIESTRGLPGWLAYLVGAGIELLSYEPPLAEVEVDGHVLERGHPTVIHVNLGRYCGGGVIFTPDAELDDGLFDVFVLGELTRLECIARWNAVTHGAGRTMPDVAIVRGKEVVIREPAGELLHADGEVRRFAAGEVRARVLSKAIEVIFAPGG
jgi:YegS/Rv2252/BmrU family lipid kinase